MLHPAPHRILIIDDDARLLHNVKRLLERQRYVVATHEGGPGCRNEVARFMPDLVLLDVKMPFLSGEGYVSLISKSATEVRPKVRPKVVFYSAVDDFTLEKMARESGVDGYISKAESGLEFARRVAQILHVGSSPLQNFEADTES